MSCGFNNPPPPPPTPPQPPPPKKSKTKKKDKQTNSTLFSCAYHLCNCDIVFVQLLWFAENAKCLTKLYTKLLVNNLYILHFLILIVKLLIHVTHLAATLTNIHNYIDYIYNFLTCYNLGHLSLISWFRKFLWVFFFQLVGLKKRRKNQCYGVGQYMWKKNARMK